MREMESKTVEVGSCIPGRLKELWIWFAAVYEWDWGDPGLLSELVKNEEVPLEFRSALSDIVAGVRKKRKFRKSSVSAQQRLILARVSMGLSELREAILSDSVEVERMSAGMRIETIEFVNAVRKAINDQLGLGIKLTGISKETLKNIRRDIQSRIDRWPTV